MRSVSTLVTALSCLTFARGLNKFGVLEVVKDFAEDILAAGRGKVPGYDAGVFTEDVAGNIDVFGKLDGREAATDFIFSTFAAVNADPEAFSPIGRPVFYNVSAISVQHDVASLSVIFDLEYPSLQMTWPLQIDGWFRVTDDREIEAFDLVFRHFPWLMGQVIADLETSLSSESNSSSTNGTSQDPLSSILIESICSTAVSGCSSVDDQFSDVAECVSALGSKPLGEWYRLQDDTLLCRALQAPLVAVSPERYCPSLASSSPVCVAQDYVSSVNETAPKGWLAAKYVTPQNAKYVDHIYAVAGQPLDPLLEVSLGEENLHSWDPTLYSTPTFGYFLIYWASAHATSFLFKRYSSRFTAMSGEHRRNVVMYAMTIVFTTIAFALQLSSIPWALGDYAHWQLQTIRTGAILISALYIFELVFRFNMRWPLIIHHCFTILAISLSVTLIEYTQSPIYVVSSIIWLTQATTEQPTFVGLLGYRLGWSAPVVAKTLKFAAVQTFILKTAAAIGVFVYWAINQRYTDRAMDYVWSAFVVILVIGLMATQVWGSWITYKIGVSVERKAPSSDRSLSDDTAQDEEKGPSASASRPNSSTMLRPDSGTTSPSPPRLSLSGVRDDSNTSSPLGMSPLVVPNSDSMMNARPRESSLAHTNSESENGGSGTITPLELNDEADRGNGRRMSQQ